ncbi:TNF receptor-associated factor 2-like isoform X4 [Amblyomma americanum]
MINNSTSCSVTELMRNRPLSGAMMVQRLRVKDGARTFGEDLVPFVTQVPETYLCSQCTSIAEDMRSDSHGHAFCDACLRELDKGGHFRCRRDGATESISKDHLPSCKPRIAKVCPRCFSKIENLPAHIKDSCPKRLISCEYCHEEKEAWTIDHHLEECDSRPATCDFCKETVQSYLKLWNDHIPVCPAKPRPCCYKEFGCTFMGTELVLEEHIEGNSHTELLLKTILGLKEHQGAALRTQQDLDTRIAHLEKQNGILVETVGNLLDEIARLK